MRLELHPNGRNDGLNTHLSIFVRLMKSEYDGILPWPFDKKVTITLIDQQPCPKLRRNIHMCSYPRNDGHFSPCYSRPVEERAQNIAFGFCKFVTQEQLKTRHYIVSDTLFFLCGSRHSNLYCDSYSCLREGHWTMWKELRQNWINNHICWYSLFIPQKIVFEFLCGDWRVCDLQLRDYEHS